MSEIDEQMAERKYRSHFETSNTGSGKPWTVTVAREGLRKARAVLDVRERAIMDLIAGKGRVLSDLAAETGRPIEELRSLYLGARMKLAIHYAQTASEAA